MALIDTNKLPVIERKPGWHGRYFDSANMTFGHYEFDKGAELHPGLLKTTQPHSFGTEREGETVTRFWTSREGAAV